jgi:hypothetical protein
MQNHPVKHCARTRGTPRPDMKPCLERLARIFGCFFALSAAFLVCSCDSGADSESPASTKSTQRKAAAPDAGGNVGGNTEARNRIEIERSKGSLREMRSVYARAYQGSHLGSSSIKGSVSIRPSETFGQSQKHLLSPGETPLELLPIWQREAVSRIRTQRQDIYDSGTKEAESIRTASPMEKREWTEKWNAKVRESLRELRKREFAALRQPSTLKPTQDTILDLIERLNGGNPELGESDLPTIEFLLPPASELEVNSDQRLDDQVVRLLEAHQILADEFPQSVGIHARH